MKPLSKREIQAIEHVMQGTKISRVAEAMNCGDRTVRFHLDNARHKMGAKNLPHLVAKFIFTHQIGNDLKAEEAA